MQTLAVVFVGEAVLKSGETQFAGVANEDYTATDFDDLVAHLFAIFEFVVPRLSDLGERVGASQVDGVCLAAGCDDALALFVPNLLLFRKLVFTHAQ